MPLYMLYMDNFQQDHAIDYLIIEGFADIILAILLLGNALQKLSLTHYTCYMVYFTI